ncbi:MAG: hypothetical protein ACR2O8_07805 [Rhizobiaceae bacterium]
MNKYTVIAANFVVPGLGSLLAREYARGWLQLLFAMLGVLLWFTGGFQLLTIPLVVFAWIWGMFTAFSYKRRADHDERVPVEQVVKLTKQKLSLMRPERR